MIKKQIIYQQQNNYSLKIKFSQQPRWKNESGVRFSLVIFQLF